MQEFTSHAPGTFCWVALSTHDTAAAKKFYSELFGWQPLDIPIGESLTYTYLQLDNKPVAALAEMQEEHKKMNIPPVWMTYVSVRDASETMNNVKQHGGQIVVDAMDVFELGKMGLFQDADGGMLGIWEPKTFPGVCFKYVPFSLCWTEFGSHDKDKAKSFYENIFNWESITENMGGMDYTLFKKGEENIAGLYALPPDLQHLPSHWLPYFEVLNIDDTKDKALKLGAEIMMPKTYVQGVGYFSVIKDPQGAVFGIVQSEPKNG